MRNDEYKAPTIDHCYYFLHSSSHCKSNCNIVIILIILIILIATYNNSSKSNISNNSQNSKIPIILIVYIK